MPIRKRHIAKAAVDTRHLEDAGVKTSDLADSAVTKPKIDPKTLQAGRTGVSFAFAAAGEENASATVSFPTGFDASPAVTVSVEGIDVGVVRIAVTATSFTVTVRDDKGTDYTTGQSATVNWVAVKV